MTDREKFLEKLVKDNNIGYSDLTTILKTVVDEGAISWTYWSAGDIIDALHDAGYEFTRPMKDNEFMCYLDGTDYFPTTTEDVIDILLNAGVIK